MSTIKFIHLIIQFLNTAKINWYPKRKYGAYHLGTSGNKLQTLSACTFVYIPSIHKLDFLDNEYLYLPMHYPKSILFVLFLALTSVGCKKETEAPKTENPKALKAADMVGTYKYNYQFTGSSVSGDLITQIIAGDNETQFHVVNFTSRNILLKVNMTGSAGTILNFSQDAFGSQLSGTGSISNNGNTVELSFTETNNASTYTGVQTMTRQ
jgi:hypothetical protein